MTENKFKIEEFEDGTCKLYELEIKVYIMYPMPNYNWKLIMTGQRNEVLEEMKKRSAFPTLKQVLYFDEYGRQA